VHGRNQLLLSTEAIGKYGAKRGFPGVLKRFAIIGIFALNVP
jgi:hypothetical protein